MLVLMVDDDDDDGDDDDVDDVQGARPKKVDHI